MPVGSVDSLDSLCYNKHINSKRNQMSKHHLVVFANYARDSGMSLVETLQYVGDNFEDLPNEITNAYEATYEELMQFCNMQDA